MTSPHRFDVRSIRALLAGGQAPGVREKQCLVFHQGEHTAWAA